MMQTSDTAAGEQVAVLEGAVPELARLGKLLAGERARQVSALESAVPDVVRLELLLADANSATLQALRDLADDPALSQLMELQRKDEGQLDLFHVLGIKDSELAHSNFLAWLLDPQGSHGLSDYFLKSFLLQTCARASALGLPGMTPARIHSIDWSTTEVRREWQYIDILILNRKAQFVCAIENKIWAEEGIGESGKSQLTWYRKTLERHFPNFARHYVFLSPSGMCSKIRKERKYWTPENYSTILELVEQTVDDNVGVLREDVRIFLRQYAFTLRRNIVQETTELQQLARQIYLKHREAIELIYQNKPDYRADFKQIIKESISDYDDWQLDSEDTSWIRFHPISWNKLGGMWTGTGWASKALVLCQFYCTNDNVHFYFTLSPGDHETVRESIIEGIRQKQGLFNRAGIAMATGWMSFHAEESIMDDSDLNNWDDESAPGPANLRAWVKNFAEKRFPDMNDVIVNCLRDYQPETHGNPD